MRGERGEGERGGGGGFGGGALPDKPHSLFNAIGVHNYSRSVFILIN